MILLVMAFAAIAFWYSVVIPAGEGVDEIRHFQYVTFIKEERSLPIQPPTREKGVEVWMGHHPPLYYLLGALAIAGIDTANSDEVFQFNPHFKWRENDGSNGWNIMQHFGQDGFPWQGAVLALHSLRIVNIILSLIGLFALYLAAKMIFGSSWIVVGLLAIIALNPSFIFMTATVHHDVLLTMIFSVGILWIVTLLKKDDLGAVFYLLGGLLAAGALLTKLSGVALLLAFLLALAVRAYRKQSLRQLLTAILLTLSPVIVFAGWWFVRNYRLYGDFLGWESFLTIHNHMERSGPYSFDIFINEFLGQISRTFWGAFGFMNITFPEIAKVFWIVTGIAFIGFIIAVGRGRLQLKRNWRIWLVMAVLSLLLFMSFLRFSMDTIGAGHARYLFPVLFVLATIIIVGLNQLSLWRFQFMVSLASVLILAWYSVWLVNTRLLPKYQAPEIQPIEDLPVQAETVSIPFVEGVSLDAYEIHHSSAMVSPGQIIPLTLYWRATDSPRSRDDEKYAVALLHDDKQLTRYVAWPERSLSPDHWQEGVHYVSDIAVFVPSQDVPERLEMVFSLFDDMAGIRKDTTVTLAEFVTTHSVVIVSPQEISDPRDIVFEDLIALRGVGDSPDPASPGDVVQFEMYWEAFEELDKDYTVFLHLLDDAGQLAAQCDRRLGGESIPSSQWETGVIYKDVCPVSLPADLAVGNYTVRAGLYSWPSLDRLQITGEGIDDPTSIILTSLIVQSTD